MTCVIRAILMKMIYGLMYQTLDQNNRDAQIGARKGKRLRNLYLLVLVDTFKMVYKLLLR